MKEYVIEEDCGRIGLYTALNLLLTCLPRDGLHWLVYPLECAVVAAEYAVYAYACGRSKKLFLLTLAANVLSYCLGLALFGHV